MGQYGVQHRDRKQQRVRYGEITGDGDDHGTEEYRRVRADGVLYAEGGGAAKRQLLRGEQENGEVHGRRKPVDGRGRIDPPMGVLRRPLAEVELHPAAGRKSHRMSA